MHIILVVGLKGELKVYLWWLLFPVKGTAGLQQLTAYDRNFAFYNFSYNLCNQALQEHWATLELLKTLHEIITLLRPLSKKLQLYSCSQKHVLRNFVYCNFCWRLSFQPLEEDWVTSGLFNILNGNNTANLWPIYVAIRVYFENCILRNFAFYRFFKYLGSQPLPKKDWTTLELLEVIHEIVTLTKVLRKNVIIVIFNKCTLLNFTFSSC